MTQKFTGQEIVEIAIRIEKNGEKLYRTLAEQTGYITVKNAFNALANEEEKHIASFDRIREIIGGFTPPEAYPGEYALYLEALVEENVFAKQDLFRELAGKAATVQEALDLAIRFEKETLIFLHGIRDAMEHDDMPVLNELIMQEKEHVLKLSEIKKTLKIKEAE
ncbi:MAG: ferritin family protein [Deltaproteobacteria bacterium]|nr:ferritin family protein [Deltaproteobacteria bacterium]